MEVEQKATWRKVFFGKIQTERESKLFIIGAMGGFLIMWIFLVLEALGLA